ncbi:PrgI family protein [Micromonospora sp. WMMD1082]|uniref:PrgI family protein n=1 Tax=Micromonospora sp. WMMD1082 TaxID=3016104 RepID=UPI002417AB15|nr:PrgI family protein [Micromonospora sp. WMMD1082]MDG4795385.1 PrgI family protein [Micromonospora sp. WMMD1082]
MRDSDDAPPRARIPADIDTPDKIVYGLTARQLAILVVAGVIGYGIIRAAGTLLSQPVLFAVLTPLAGAAVVLALGRRDGLPMDAWLLAAIRHTRDPKRLAPAPSARPSAVPGWAPDTDAPAAVPLLRLPATAISDAGVIDTGPQAVALVACTTVNIGLRTGDEQNALISAYGRWLNSLSSPVQIVISAQRVDLSSHAQRIADTADTLANPALAEAAVDYAEFLDDLAARRDPLWRTVTIAVTARGEKGRDTEVLRRAEHAASALSALGAQTAVLDGARATAVLTCAVDPYTPTDVTWPRARPDAVITGPGDPA